MHSHEASERLVGVGSPTGKLLGLLQLVPVSRSQCLKSFD